ncbi:MAG: hypothetical protein P1V18_02185 [Candidatus Gracilibacteria bacterium]|nr:hypothetical protein [Candidatus Gracilibacteria bacterium]
MSDNKKSSKFVTSILIGGALGSLLAWVFGSKKKKRTMMERAHDMVTPEPVPKKGFFSRIFRK